MVALAIHYRKHAGNSVDRLHDGSSYVPRVPGYLKTSVIIIKKQLVHMYLTLLKPNNKWSTK